MNLRAMFQPRQLLSTIFGVTSSVLVAGTVSLPVFLPQQTHAQAPAQAAGVDIVVMKPVANQPPRTLQGVTITGMQGTKVMVQDASGQIAYDLAQIQSVTKAAPVALAQAQQMIEKGNLEGALPTLKAIADRFKGLPTQWAMESVSMLGTLYVSLNKLPEAELTFRDLEQLYGGSNSKAANIGKARLAAAKKQFSEAKSLATEIVSGALAQKNISRAESQLYGQAYYILGQCAEGEGKLPEAMENYCRTVAIFYQEPTIVAEAQKRIDELRKNKVTTP